jgi:two-component system chemotaxis response regulator CheB
LEEIYETGAQTIAQDKKTSVVWGMPGEAVKRGAVIHLLAIHDIAAKLIELGSCK